ncbi:uncharacterized protein LOC110986599 [Acanthaster planci]|uniref:Uncharacterized protein LOC110986599 n=1 Tax=Acanthaster planci TaxID=133434 RepID=A0A8B7ZGZ5_ACAPL|nr:uncharacterized protein LOC110986599 [Acanthaster planci]
MKSTINEIFHGFKPVEGNNQAFDEQDGVDFSSSGLSAESGLGSTSPVTGELSPCTSPFPFTPEQESDLGAVYAANPFLDFRGRDILADALNVTEEDVHAWFIQRRYIDSYLQQRSSTPHQLFQTSTSARPVSFEMPSSTTISPTALTFAACVGCHLPCLLSATVTATYTHAPMTRQGPRHSATGSGDSVSVTTTTCHRAPVVICRYAASLSMLSRNTCRHRPVGSVCLRRVSRLSGFAVSQLSK